MSRSKGDTPHRPQSVKRCPESAAGGCQWCGTGKYKRALRRLLRHGASKDVADRTAD